MALTLHFDSHQFADNQKDFLMQQKRHSLNDIPVNYDTLSGNEATTFDKQAFALLSFNSGNNIVKIFEM